MANLMSLPYPSAPKPGFWEPNSSPLNFCEEEYMITSYIAEFINTLTNISHVIYAIYGIRKFYSHKEAWDKTLPYYGIALVGITSALFHGTLRAWPQYSDDLSMLVATGIIYHRIFSFGKSAAYVRNHGLIATAVLVVISFYHCLTAEHIVHQATFVLMVFLIARRIMHVIRERVSDPVLKKQLIGLAKGGAYFSILAATVWLIDERACSYLKLIRDIVGLPWGFLFELHGWWHVLTAFAVYDYFVLVEILTGEGSVEQNIIDGSPFAWPVSWQLSKVKKN